MSRPAKFVQSQRAAGVTVGRSPSSTTTTSGTSPSGKFAPPPMRSPSAASSGFSKSPQPSHSSLPSTAPPPYSPPMSSSSYGSATKRAPPPPPPLKPKPRAEPEKQYVVALYDFEAQADGDLDFKAGDRIEVVERTESAEDWWTGKVNGRQGVFPGTSMISFGAKFQV